MSEVMSVLLAEGQGVDGEDEGEGVVLGRRLLLLLTLMLGWAG